MGRRTAVARHGRRNDARQLPGPSAPPAGRGIRAVAGVEEDHLEAASGRGEPGGPPSGHTDNDEDASGSIC